jgi:Glycerophosphoryl diester phosphodiesterase family
VNSRPLAAVAALAATLAASTSAHAAPAACTATPDPARWVDAGTPDPAPRRGVFAVHRGGGTLAPEETIGAYSASVAYGADWIEGDIHETKDGHYVLIHDDTLTRLTGGKDHRAVNTVDLAELKKVNIANYDEFAKPSSPKYAYNPSHLTELGEALAFASANGVGMDLDIKNVSSATDLVAYASQWPKAFAKTFFEADPWEAAGVHAQYPDANVMYNVAGGDLFQFAQSPADSDPGEPAGYFYAATQAPFNYRFFGSSLSKFPASRVAELHDGCAIALPHSYDRGNANEAEEIKTGRARGIDGFQVNQPDVAAAALGRPVATAIRFPDSRTVCLRNAGNGNGLPYKPLTVGALPVTTAAFGCTALPAHTAPRTRVTFAGDASSLASAARTPRR